MKATKGNRIYNIDDAQKGHYKDAGFDIMDDEGNVLEYGRGKTVPYDEYAAVAAKLEALKADAEAEAEVKKGKAAKKEGE